MVSYTLVFPAAQGGAGTTLVNDGSGNLSWALQTGLTIGTYDSQSASANGLVISSSVLYAQSASVTVPGMVNTGTQSFSGNKTFTGSISSSNFTGSSSGTNTGDVTLSVIGSTPNANAATLTGQILNLQPANSSFGGVVTTGTQTFSGDKSFLGNVAVGTISAGEKLHIATTVPGDISFRIQSSGTTGDTGTIRFADSHGSYGAIRTTFTDSTITSEDSRMDFWAATNLDHETTDVFSQSPSLTLMGGNGIFPGTITASNFTGASTGTNTGDVTIGTANGLSILGQVLSLQLSSATLTGALSSADFNTFNAKQDAGNYITALTGDATATGPGSVPITLATVNANVGSFGTATDVATFTVNAKGLITAASNTPIQITESQVTGLVADLASKITNPMTTLGDMIYEDATPAPARLPGNITTTKKFLTQTGTGTVSAAPMWDVIVAGDVPTLNQNTTGTASNVTGVVAIANGGTGATTSAGARAAFGLPPTVQKFTSGSGTYTTPTSPAPLYIRVMAVGAGGGGAGSGTAAVGSGGNGGNTTFGTSLLAANGGGGATSVGAGGVAGTASLGTGPIGTALSGSSGTGASLAVTTAAQFAGAPGGASALGGAGGGAEFGGAAGKAGTTNTGGGGGGGSTNGDLSESNGSGGGSGGFVDAIIATPGATYSYAVGAAGTAGAAGTNGHAGGSGGSGYIIVEEFYL